MKIKINFSPGITFRYNCTLYSTRACTQTWQIISSGGLTRVLYVVIYHTYVNKTETQLSVEVQQEAKR